MARSPYVSIHIKNARPGHKVSAQDIVASVIHEVRSGKVPPGCRVPPVRALEQQLGLSKNTVQAAYDELVLRGVLETREREGVFVSTPREVRAAAPRVFSPPLPLCKPPALPPVSKLAKDVVPISSVFIDSALLPREKLADCVRSVLKYPGMSPMYDQQGYPPLRETIAARLRARGMHVQADEVVITTGSQQALDIVGRILEVRRVVMENPVYAGARHVFETNGLGCFPLQLDPFAGIDLGEWEEQVRAIKPGLAYAITSFQNPTGYSYTTHELLEVLRIAEKHNMALLEDDWGSDMLSFSEYRPGLRALGGERVLYVNSFTKKLLPSLRLGYLVADASLIPALVSAKRLSTLGNSWLLEATLHEFLDRGYYDGHLSSLQKELDHRYEHCLHVLREVMPEGARWTTPGGGPTLWLDLPRGVDLRSLREHLLERKVEIGDPSVSFFGGPHLNGFRISYAHVAEEKMTWALEIIGDTLRQKYATAFPT